MTCKQGLTKALHSSLQACRDSDRQNAYLNHAGKDVPGIVKVVLIEDGMLRRRSVEPSRLDALNQQAACHIYRVLNHGVVGILEVGVTEGQASSG